MSEHAAPVQATPAPAQQSPAAKGFQLRRKCACGSYGSGGGSCDKCSQDENKLQRAAAGPGKPEGLPESVHEVLGSGGHPLDATTRSWMEPRFKYDFSSVRVHTDSRAARSAKDVNALAYTVGRDVVFGPGQYAPGTERGTRLLAHELTHVVQQTSSGASAQQAAKAVSDPGDAAEVEADATANLIMSGEAVRVTQAPNATLHALNDVETGLLAGGLAVAGVGLTFLALGLAGVFDRERYSAQELTEYLSVLARTRRIENNRNSDNKARDVVRHWRAGEAAFNINDGFAISGGSVSGVELKRLLIKEMLSGVTAGEDEEAILTILENSTAEQVLQILDPANGIPVQTLDDKIGGENHARFERILETVFPAGSPIRQRTTTTAENACSARQALQIEFAQRLAIAMVDNVIEVMTARPNDQSLRSALDCRFRGASPAQIQGILDVFRETKTRLGDRLYHCGPEGGAAALEENPLTLTTGHRKVAKCFDEDADAFVASEGDSPRDVFLCGVFFRRSPEDQATTLVHESAHVAGRLTTDPQYRPPCGFDLSVALTNADSFAYFASDLMSRRPDLSTSERPLAGSGMPSVSVGNFRNSGPLSDDNHCEVCGDLPGLGLDNNTFLNIMELRGDISEHRTGVEYDFKRTKERAIWKSTDQGWEMLQYDARGTDDDRSPRDEDITPENNHLYSIDGPGLLDLFNPIPDAATAHEAVYKASFVEWVNARVAGGPWTQVSNQFDWHSVTWLENLNGNWQRKRGQNEIEPGPIIIGAGLPYGPGDYPLPDYTDGVPA
jgi:hypothetical protein